MSRVMVCRRRMGGAGTVNVRSVMPCVMRRSPMQQGRVMAAMRMMQRLQWMRSRVARQTVCCMSGMSMCRLVCMMQLMSRAVCGVRQSVRRVMGWLVMNRMVQLVSRARR